MPPIENTRRRDSSVSKANSAATRFASAERPGWVRRISNSPMWLPGSYVSEIGKIQILGKKESFLFLCRSPHFFIWATDEAFRFHGIEIVSFDPGESRPRVKGRFSSSFILSVLLYTGRTATSKSSCAEIAADAIAERTSLRDLAVLMRSGGHIGV